MSPSNSFFCKEINKKLFKTNKQILRQSLEFDASVEILNGIIFEEIHISFVIFQVRQMKSKSLKVGHMNEAFKRKTLIYILQNTNFKFQTFEFWKTFKQCPEWEVVFQTEGEEIY